MCRPMHQRSIVHMNSMRGARGLHVDGFRKCQTRNVVYVEKRHLRLQLILTPKFQEVFAFRNTAV